MSSPTNQLQPSLRRRHMNLIALGGVIGAGLFVGTGVVIQSTGPAVVVSLLIAGLLTVLVMRMLAEMAVSRPAHGAFYVHAAEALGPRGGFAVGWLYWYFFVIVVAVEAVAGGKLVQQWLPGVPLWVVSLVLLTTLVLTNLRSARTYGEFEYWFSSIKVVAIVLFLVLGASALLGWWPGVHPGLTNLTAHGGFAPQGAGAVLVAVVPCVAFYTGTEIVTIAASESAEPQRAVARAMRSIILRVVAFYVLSVFVVVAVVPWNSPQISDSPYAAVLDALHIPAAGTIMNVVVLTAVLSCLNSALYTSSRMLHALARRGDAPAALSRLSPSGVPRRAILAGTLVGYFSVLGAYASPDLIFSFLVNSYGAVALFVYLAVAVSQVVLRRRVTDPSELPLRMWFFPWLSYLTIAVMTVVVLAMAFLPSTSSQFWFSLVTLGVVLIAYEVRKRSGSSGQDVGQVVHPSPTATGSLDGVSSRSGDA